MTILSRLQDILEYELTISHTEGHSSRKSFIKNVVDRYGIDPVFDNLVKDQLNMFVNDFVDPYTFCATCNNPDHKIRNMLIVWSIDHP